MAEIRGNCEAPFEDLKVLMRDFVASGKEVGASLVVNVDGEDKVNIWGGYADETRTRPWDADTIVDIFSSSKTVAGLAALLLVERGLLDANAPVSKYWPEFAANGKQGILVRHVISHTSGVSGFDEPMILEDLYDWDKTTSILARQAPFWTPGTQSGYHSFTMGFFVGELVRRTTGKTYKDFVAEEIAGPLEADFQIGVKDCDLQRVSDVIPFPPPLGMPQVDPSSTTFKSMMNPPFEPSLANTAGWRHADLGAANGHSNALGVARIISTIALGGEVDSKRLLSPSTIELIFQEQSRGKDIVTGQTLRFGIGFGLSGKDTAVSFLPEGRICFWGGLGGSMIIADLDRRMTISYMMNKLSPVGLASDRAKDYIAAIYKALGVNE